MILKCVKVEEDLVGAFTVGRVYSAVVQETHKGYYTVDDKGEEWYIDQDDECFEEVIDK